MVRDILQCNPDTETYTKVSMRVLRACFALFNIFSQFLHDVKITIPSSVFEKYEYHVCYLK